MGRNPGSKLPTWYEIRIRNLNTTIETLEKEKKELEDKLLWCDTGDFQDLGR